MRTVGAVERTLRSLTVGIATLAVTLLGLLLCTFVIGRVMPIDPVVAAVGDKASAETYAAAREALGLDRPLYVQFARYVAGVAQGDLGLSTASGRAVAEDIGRAFPATVELATLAILVGTLAGVPLGVYAAHRRNRWPDHLIRVTSLVGYSMPIFWLGLIALLIFYAQLGWVSGPGRIGTVYRYTLQEWSGFLLVDTLRAGDMGAFRSAFSHLILPAVLLGYVSLAYIARMTRGFMIEELGKDYVVTARIKGASEARVLWLHALPNVMVPLVTVIALSFGHLLEGAVLTETVFAWPGIGLYITSSLFTADMPAVLGGTLVVGLCFVALNKLAELLYPLLDPRTRTA
jgi:peptide/nickel transport system permease protein